MANKLRGIMTFLDELLPAMSSDTLITRPGEERGSLTGGGSTRKHLNCHQTVGIGCDKEK